MTTKLLKLLTNSADIPLLYEQAARHATDNTDASPRMPASSYGDKINADYGQPQIIYLENVLPYAKGIFSISYGQKAPAVSPATTGCDQCIQLRDARENQFAYIPANGANYVFDNTTDTWVSVNPFTFTEGTLVTRAYVNGRTFICFEKSRIIEYDSTTNTFSTVALTFPSGLSMLDVRGIGGAANYLLFFTEITVYWCSPLNILEFDNLDEGAGNQIPIDIQGQITALISAPGGFIVYSARNAVGATFTNNGNAPFAFKGIGNAGGVANWECVAGDSDRKGHYIWGTKGLQHVTLTECETMFPEVTDFLVGNIDESWDTVDKEVVPTYYSDPFAVKLAFLAGRYLVASYGSAPLDYKAALVYDASLRRWGKLVIEHCDAFMFPYVSGLGAYTYAGWLGIYDDYPVTEYIDLGTFFLAVPPAKRGIAFLKTNGEVYIANMDFNQSNSTGVVIFGHIQQRHDRHITIQKAKFDGINTVPAPQVTLLGSVDGYTRSSVTPMTQSALSGKFREYSSRYTAENFDLVLEGNFVISSVLVDVMNHGSR